MLPYFFCFALSAFQHFVELSKPVPVEALRHNFLTSGVTNSAFILIPLPIILAVFLVRVMAGCFHCVRLLCLYNSWVFSAAWEAEGGEFGCYSVCFGFRYSNMICFILRRLCFLFDSGCLKTDECYERRGFSLSFCLWTACVAARIKSSWTPTCLDRHPPGRESVLWKQAMIWLTVSLPPSCWHSHMGLIWYHNRGCFSLSPSREKDNLSSLLCLFLRNPQIPPQCS